ncbi:MAG TPA: hypothetical protein VFV72_09760 [Candidatus Limnocylindrales bacterium]|nr:hypothetical protein [Candidatus Limnocylindrales bacterium]
MPARPVAHRAAALLLLLPLLAACGSPPSPSPSPARFDTPRPSIVASTPFAFPLVSIETRGGDCPAGGCNRLLNIEADGRIHEVIPEDRIVGTVPPDVIDALRTEVEQADYLAIRGHPFTGECPTAVDGQEIVYTFHVTTGDREIASCTVAIDPADPLFVAVNAAMAYEQPTE